MNCVRNNEDYDANQAMMYMIDINTTHLNGLRTTCSLTESLTQAEIRSAEDKLIKLFGKQLYERQLAISNNNNFNVPSLELRKWLYIVGLNDNLIQSIINRIGDEFDNLLNLNQTELDELMSDSTSDEKRKFNTAMNNLKLFIEKLKLNDITANDLDLHWDSWDQSKLENIIEEDDCHTINNSSNQLNDNTNSLYSPLDESKNLIVNSREQLDIETPNSTNKSSSKDFNKLSPSTPPPPSYYHDKNYNCNNSNIPKSKSHEDQLTNKVDLKDRNPELFDSLKYRRKRLESEPCTGSNMLQNYSNSRSPIVSPDNLNNAQSDSCFEEQTSLTNSCTNVTAPRSPRGQGMLHAIKHRFANRLNPKSTFCNLCNKPLIFGFKCKEKKCKYKCHKECLSKVPPSCGLPPEFFIYFKEALSQQSIQQHSPQIKLNKKNKFKTNVKKSSPDSSSNASSRNSSAPPSPIQPNITNNKTLNCSNSSLTAQNKSFTFNDNINQQQNQHYHKLQPTINSDKNDLNDNKQIVNKNLNNLNSQTSDADSQNTNENRQWPRQNSLTIKEWDIPFDEIIKEKEIGRFGTVFKGKWHGQVVIKMFNMANGLDDKKAIEAFKDEVATFRKTRHENLVLFMGSCMNPPHLAIVTSYCKGLPLYNHLYERKFKFNLNRIISIGGQISQGMGYLHARGIIHKDLRSKNIFYDNANNKVTISDFGFFSLTKLCFSNDEHKDRLKIPKGWLCYLAPELIKSLRAGNGQEQDDLPFSFATDMFSFGTIWHELIFLHPPFDSQPAEVVIWQVGKGIKQSLVNLNASKEIKDILMLCWAYKPSERPEFSKLVDILTNLPKKRLQRSPSHPTQLMTNKLL